MLSELDVLRGTRRRPPQRCPSARCGGWCDLLFLHASASRHGPGIDRNSDERQCNSARSNGPSGEAMRALENTGRGRRSLPAWCRAAGPSSRSTASTPSSPSTWAATARVGLLQFSGDVNN